jgi:hypothetical protein
MSAISSLYLSSPPSSTWPLAAGVPLYLAVENLACCVVVPTATWCPRQRNRLPKLFDDQLWPVLRVEWSKIPNFGVRWLEPNSSDSSMVKNELFQKKSCEEISKGKRQLSGIAFVRRGHMLAPLQLASPVIWLLPRLHRPCTHSLHIVFAEIPLASREGCFYILSLKEPARGKKGATCWC